MLKESSLDLLRGTRNLLAFSAGGDSTALFFLLKNANIDFDIAIVNYNIREQSLEEVAHAKELANKYNMKCHIFNAPQITKNFEAKAREIRYNFFDSLINENRYNNLLTAHHLGDRFEWMLMQFCKGAGCIELAGMHESQRKDNYTLVRPLLHLDKSELLQYLKTNNIKYFEDTTNQDENIKRNHLRHNYTQPLLQMHLDGIKKSFEYIDEDREQLSQEVNFHSIDELTYFSSTQNKRADIFAIDKYLKENKYLLSFSQRKALKEDTTVVVGRKFLIVQEHSFVFILPFEKHDIAMTKEFKEECRNLKIEKKLRPYLFKNKKVFAVIKKLLF